jgi:isocitrate dehydrogenase
MSNLVPVTVAYGDGIGPEIMEVSLHIIQEAGARIQIEKIEIGEKVYLRGNTAGIEPSAWESLRRTKVFYKAPITTPQGGGFKSLNFTARTSTVRRPGGPTKTLPIHPACCWAAC